MDVSYKYGYLDKVIEINRKGKVTKFKYDAMGMLIEKILPDGQSEKWVWDGIALVARGNDIYVNEPHVSGGIPILTKTDKGVRYHTSDILGTTLWSTDMKGNRTDSYADTNVFGEGSIQYDRSTRFTGKPYDEDLQAFVFPFRNYKAEMARWTSSDPSGFPDGINNHFYACVPTMEIDPLGLCTYVLGVRVATCGVHKTDSGSGTKDMGEVDKVKFGCGGAKTESHTTSSQSGGSFGINIPTAWGTINASVNYSATASKTRTYENHASCENPSAEHEIRGEGYVGIHLYVDYNWTATLYECGESDYSITNVKSYIGDNGWTTISTCVEK